MADPYEMIVANQFNLPAIDAAASQARRGRLAEMMAGRKMEREEREASRRSQTREEAIGLYRSGDKQGARETAAFGGDSELFSQLDSLEDVQREAIKQRGELIGHVAQWADTPEKWDRGVDFLVASGHADVAQYKGRFSPETRMAALSAADQLKTYYERTKPLVGRPGDWIMDPNDPSKVLQKVPHAPHYGTVGEGEKDYAYQPGGGDFNTWAGAAVAQESSGRYNAVSPVGAMGKYQVMPQTGENLAKQLGLPWRPDLMATDTPEARQYQDQIGGAALQEAWEASDGNPDIASAYYHGGPNREQWGPKTQAHVKAVRARMGDGTRIIAEGPPKAAGSGDDGTPDGLLSKGYRVKPDGTMEPVPGGPADPGSVELPAPKEMAKRNAAYPKVSSAYRGSTKKIDEQLADIKSLLSSGGLNRIVGLIDANTPNLSPASRRAQALYDRVMARAQFNELQEMRNSSPTGGALGQVTDWEGKVLRQAAAALDRNQEEEDFKARLQDYVYSLETAKGNIEQAFEDTYAYREQEKAAARPAATGGGNVIRYDAQGRRIP